MEVFEGAGEDCLALDLGPQSERQRCSTGNRQPAEQGYGRIKVKVERAEARDRESPSGQGSVFPVHLILNAIFSSRGFDATKSRTAVKESKGCLNSRLARCLSLRTSGVMSVEARA